MTKFIIENADGSVGIMDTFGDVKPEECVAKWAEPLRSQVASIAPAADADVPNDRTFRDAWVRNGSAVGHDMEKCRAIHMARVRKARDARLLEKDREWMVAFSREDVATADAIEAERQVLRDVPQTVDADIKAATRPDDLKAIWPLQLSGTTSGTR